MREKLEKLLKVTASEKARLDKKKPPKVNGKIS